MIVLVRSIGSCCRQISIVLRSGIFAVGISLGPALGAGSGSLRILDAWVPAADAQGLDVPLLMTVENDANEPDVLLRVNCPFANFAEKHIVDRGEGTPAMRAIRSIPVPANKAIVLKPDGYHVMLLQTRQALNDGETLVCTIVFEKAGTLETEVHVTRSPR